MNIRCVKRYLLIEPSALKPFHSGFEVVAAFNPGVVEIEDTQHLLIRVAERPCEKRDGFVALPRMGSEGRIIIDWISEEEIVHLDERGVLIKKTGLHRFKSISHLRLATSTNGKRIDKISDTPVIYPKEEYETFGIEDPRISIIENVIYITYVAVSEQGICTALATSHDCKSVTRHNLIFLPENKNVVLFPEKIDGHFFALHRPNGLTPLAIPSIWTATSIDALHWGRFQPLSIPNISKKFNRIGAGTPPLKIGSYWLVLVHAVIKNITPRSPGVYTIHSLVLDANTPTRVVSFDPEPLISLIHSANASSLFSQIVFPTGAIIKEDALLVFCGEQDRLTTVYEISLRELFLKLGLKQN